MIAAAPSRRYDPIIDALAPDTSPVINALVGNQRRFLRFLESRVRSRSDAEEILQAAFVKSMEKGDDVRDPDSAVAWFYRLLRNAVTDYYRRAGAERRAVERSARMDVEAEVDDELHEEVCRCVDHLLVTLKSEYAELLRRVDRDGESLPAVAADLGITGNNARVRLHRARRALRHQLERSCGACAHHGCLDCSCRRHHATS